MLLPMTPRTKKTAAALSGALVLASGAYALGQPGGRRIGARREQRPNATSPPATASAAGPGHRSFRGGPREALADAAKQLGVSEDKLLTALRTLRDERKGDDGR